MPIRTRATALGAALLVAGAMVQGQPAAARGGGGGGGHGGGHGGHVVSSGGVYVAGVSVPYYMPPTQSLALEITDAPVTNTEGVMQIGDVIARHTVRAADAIVLDAPVHTDKRDIPAGAVLARVTAIDSGKTYELWCDMSTSGIATPGAPYDCVSDPDHTGAVNQIWSAITGDAFFGWGGLNNVHWRDKITPARYHKATPQERPTGQIGYAWCSGDGVSTPPRFELSGSFAGGAWTTSRTHACSFGAWASGDHAAVVLDHLVLHTAPGPKDATITFRVDGRIAPMPIAHMAPGGGVRAQAAADADAQADRVAEGIADLVPTGAPATLSDRPIAKGEVLFHIEALHGVAGVLVNDIWMGSYNLLGKAGPPNKPVLKAGAPVYALHMRAAGGERQIVWCAPVKTRQGYWDFAACMPSDGAGFIWTNTQPPLMASEVIMNTSVQPDYVTPPIVKRGANGLAPMLLNYVFEGWTRDGNALVGLMVDSVQVRLFLGRSRAAGTFPSVVPVVGGYLEITPNGTDKTRVDVAFKAAQ